ncbi:MAG: AraC family transcriptional regulator [Verrucomicrobiae bacterium]
MHSHPAVEIVYHATGQGETRVAGRSIPFQARSAVIYAPQEIHDQSMAADGEDLCVQVALPRSVCRKLDGGFFVPRIGQPWLIAEIQNLCRSRAQPGGLEQRVFDLRAAAVLLALVDIATKASREDALPPCERHVMQAEQFMGEHFASISSLRDVAEHVGVSHDHLRHLFTKARGRSMVRHLNEFKIARAKILLTNSPLPLKQIAATCGFKDEYYFSAVFRRLTSVSPGLYRNNGLSLAPAKRTNAGR